MTVEPKVVAAIDLSTRGGFAWAAKSRLNDDPLTRQVTSAPGPAGALAGGPENLAAIASYLRETRMAALADIAAGEEITCNYHEFDPSFSGRFASLQTRARTMRSGGNGKTLRA